VFVDDLARLNPDPHHSVGEEPFILFGLSTQLKLLLVSHCEVNSETIRIISARKADKSERKQYEGYCHA
jgi:uncharacterized DUF497 family protein